MLRTHQDLRSLCSATLPGLIVVLAAAGASRAAPFDFDPTFGTGGQVRTGFGNGMDDCKALATQLDGKFVFAGSTTGGGSQDRLFVVRYLVDGSPDGTFGTNGKVVTSFGTSQAFGTAIAVQADGKIVVGGHDGKSFLVARYLSNGDLDPSFDGDGRVVTVPTAFLGITGQALAIQADGKIVIAGTHRLTLGESDFIVARFNSNGSLDATFDGDGFSGTTLASFDTARALAISSDGKIVLAGESDGGTGKAIALARFNSNGSLDATFDGDGRVITFVSGLNLTANAIALQLSDANPAKILVAGSTNVAGGADFASVRYQWTGALDTTFDGDGVMVRNLAAGTDVATSVRILYTGATASRIVMAGHGQAGVGFPFGAVVAKFLLTGAFDTTFDVDGVASVSMGVSNVYVNAMTRTSAGKILTVGTMTGFGDSEVASIQLTATGSLDTAWDLDGKRLEDVGDAGAQAVAVAARADGGIVAAGQTNDGARDVFAVACYRTDGTLDPTFAGGGRTTFVDDSQVLSVAGMALQSNDQILMAGTVIASGEGDYDFEVVRLDADGSPDASFGAAAVARIDFGFGPKDIAYDEVHAILLQPDQRILLAGRTNSSFSSPADWALARCLPDGSPDSSFGGIGRVRYAVSNQGGCANAIALQPDGKICVAGFASSNSGTGSAVLVARHLPDGTNDHSFGWFGFATALADSDGVGQSIAVQGDGRIVVGGSALGGRVALLRFHTDGSLDTSFGNGGCVITPVGTNGLGARAIEIRPNGSLRVLSASNGPLGLRSLLLCYHGNGTLDTSYGSGGIVEVELGPTTSDLYTSMTRDSAQRVVLAGTESLFAVARLEGEAIGTHANLLDATPASFRLGRPSPNPTRGVATIRFESTSDAPIEAKIFDVAGRLVRSLDLEGDVDAGARAIRWDGRSQGGRSASPGVYFLRVRQAGHTQARPITILR